MIYKLIIWGVLDKNMGSEICYSGMLPWRGTFYKKQAKEQALGLNHVFPSHKLGSSPQVHLMFIYILLIILNHYNE